MNWAKFLLVGAFLAGLVSETAAADPYLKEELRIPFVLAGPRGLEALLVRPSKPGRYPLALIAHGSPRSIEEHPKMTPWAMLPQAIEFARRGWAAVVVMRRGYGNSGGDGTESYGPCANPNYVAGGTAGAADLKASIDFLANRPDIDRSRVISVGVSAGGFAPRRRLAAMGTDCFLWPASRCGADSSMRFCNGMISEFVRRCCRRPRVLPLPCRRNCRDAAAKRSKPI